MPQTGTLLIARDIGAGWSRRHLELLSRSLQTRLHQPVIPAPADDPESLAAAIQRLAETGCDRLIVLPLGLLPVPATGGIPRALAWARREWPALVVQIGVPLTWLEWAAWIRQTGLDAVRTLTPTASGTLLLVGRGTEDPLIDAELARLACLVGRRSPFQRVDYAFLDGTAPRVVDVLPVLMHSRESHTVVIPWQVEETDFTRLEQSFPAGPEHGGRITLAVPELAHPALVNLLIANHLAAQDTEPFCEPSARNPSTDPDGGLSPQAAYELRELERRINALLPSEYQGRYESVSPRSMGTAALKLDQDGNVAWDEIWTSFCDLALAGGPPHRGTLLEAVTSEQALADRDAYEAVVAEIARGIQLVTALPIVPSAVPGWIGVRCASEEMAVWLMRAILVENIMVRRESDILYLPAGPHFTVKREIKNVITSVAKTVHYWTAHLTARRIATERQTSSGR